MLREGAEATAKRIGLKKIDSPVYNSCPVGIRFEIGDGDPFFCYRLSILSRKYFRKAEHRAVTIYQNAPGTFDTLLWIIYPYGENTEKKLLDRFCEITRLPPPQERYSEIVPLEDDPDALLEEVRCYWDLQAYPANIELLFKEIVRTDFGGFRELEYWVYLLDTKLNVLLNLYDDRGLDIAAGSHDVIIPLCEKYGDWIMNNLSGKISDLASDGCENFDHIETLVLSKLASVVEVSKLKKDDRRGYYIIDSKNDLWLEVCDSEGIVCYSKEHHHIMRMDYETMDEWASEVCRFLGLLVNRTVRFECFFRGEKQIRVKLYSLHNGKEELIEHIRTTLNPFLLNSKDVRKEVKLIEFKQQ